MSEDSLNDARAFAQAIAALMNKHGAYASDITFRLRYGGDVFENYRMTFDRGRHDEAGQISLVRTSKIEFAEETKP